MRSSVVMPGGSYKVVRGVIGGMIITGCTECDHPILTSGGIPGTYAPVECEECGATMVVEITQIGGKTYEQETFENDVLPGLENVERIDHPSGEATIYGDPDQVHVRA